MRVYSPSVEQRNQILPALHSFAAPFHVGLCFDSAPAVAPRFAPQKYFSFNIIYTQINPSAN